MQERFCRRKQAMREILNQQYPVCCKVLDFFRDSFLEGEVLMICSRYPDYDVQCRAYRCFIRDLGLHSDSSDWTSLARNWMDQHDLIYDRYFLNWLSSHPARTERSAVIRATSDYVILPVRYAKFC